MTNLLAAFSDAIAAVVASAAPLICAIRVAPNRHVTGLIVHAEAIVTTDQALPALDSYTAVLSDGSMTEVWPGPRGPACNLAVLRLDMKLAVTLPNAVVAPVGSLVVVLGADMDGSPTVRVTVIHRFTRTADGPAPVLDLPQGSIDQGGPVLDSQGRLVGIAALGPNNEPIAIPSAALGRVLKPNQQIVGRQPGVPAALDPAPGRRGWLGVALQPITVPEPLVGRAGQRSGRMVVSITKSGPADQAGLRVGDVLLALDGTGATGPHALRAFLGADRIGSKVEIRMLREGNILTTHLVVAVQPG